jgi:hypothetical protein
MEMFKITTGRATEMGHFYFLILKIKLRSEAGIRKDPKGLL